MDKKLLAALNKLFDMKKPSIAHILKARGYTYEAEVYEQAAVEFERCKSNLIAPS